MRSALRTLRPVLALVLATTPVAAQGVLGRAAERAPSVEFDRMTWPEVRAALEAGRTTALDYNGGTEQRGPQNVNGGHTLMARETARAIALELGDAVAAPVLPFSPNRASAELPGTTGITNELFAAINEQVAEPLIISGFKDIVLMGDHGWVRKELVKDALDVKVRYAVRQIRELLG